MLDSVTRFETQLKDIWTERSDKLKIWSSKIVFKNGGSHIGDTSDIGSCNKWQKNGIGFGKEADFFGTGNAFILRDLTVFFIC